jgi:DUF1680 family protein
MIYYRANDGLAVNLFTASSAQAEAGGTQVRVRQETQFPNEGDVAIHVDPARPASFALHIRIPAWAKGAAVQVNQEAPRGGVTAGRFAVVNRPWKTGWSAAASSRRDVWRCCGGRWSSR